MGAAPMLQRNWLRSSLIGIRSLFHTKASRLITDETGQPVLIELTESAVKKLVQVAAKKGPERILRVSVESGGCHGFQYKFALEPANSITPSEDIMFTRDNGKIVIDETSLRLLSGSQIDYTEEMIGSDFRVIENPRADSGCGCGVSFNLAPNK